MLIGISISQLKFLYPLKTLVFPAFSSPRFGPFPSFFPLREEMRETFFRPFLQPYPAALRKFAWPLWWRGRKCSSWYLHQNVPATPAHPWVLPRGKEGWSYKLFFQWGISFGEPYTVPDKGNRPVAYAGKNTLVKAIREKFPPPKQEQLSVEEISVEVRAAQPKPTEKVTPPPQSAQPKQPDTKVHANAPTRRKTTSGKEREDDRP